MKVTRFEDIKPPDGWKIVSDNHPYLGAPACDYLMGTIFVGKRGDSLYPRSTPIHEYTHAKWKEKGLGIQKYSDRVKHEVVAFVAEIHYTLKIRDIETASILRDRFIELKQAPGLYVCSPEHLDAVNILMSCRIWDRLNQFIQENADASIPSST